MEDAVTATTRGCSAPRCTGEARYAVDAADPDFPALPIRRGVPVCAYHLQWLSNHGRLLHHEELREEARA